MPVQIILCMDCPVFVHIDSHSTIKLETSVLGLIYILVKQLRAFSAHTHTHTQNMQHTEAIMDISLDSIQAMINTC